MMVLLLYCQKRRQHCGSAVPDTNNTALIGMRFMKGKKRGSCRELPEGKSVFKITLADVKCSYQLYFFFEIEFAKLISIHLKNPCESYAQ